MLLWLIENTLLSVPLAALAWLACRGLRLSPAVRHGLWLVVLLKLMSPPLFAWPAFSPPARFVAWLAGEPNNPSTPEDPPSPDTVGRYRPPIGPMPDAAHAPQPSVLVE